MRTEQAKWIELLNQCGMDGPAAVAALINKNASSVELAEHCLDILYGTQADRADTLTPEEKAEETVILRGDLLALLQDFRHENDAILQEEEADAA